jgi:hypothetical protein
MREDLATRLTEIAERLERDAEVAAACGLRVTTKLLRMARLDLLCHIHDISEGELQAIGDELKRNRPAAEHAAPGGPRLKPPH